MVKYGEVWLWVIKVLGPCPIICVPAPHQSQNSRPVYGRIDKARTFPEPKSRSVVAQRVKGPSRKWTRTRKTVLAHPVLFLEQHSGDSARTHQVVSKHQCGEIKSKRKAKPWVPI